MYNSPTTLPDVCVSPLPQSQCDFIPNFETSSNGVLFRMYPMFSLLDISFLSISIFFRVFFPFCMLILKESFINFTFLFTLSVSLFFFFLPFCLRSGYGFAGIFGAGNVSKKYSVDVLVILKLGKHYSYPVHRFGK